MIPWVYAQDIPSAVLTAEPWASADSLFRGDPKWLGGDAASSIVIKNDRVLWLFGDSFIATGKKPGRDESVIIRNTVAIQSGTDPSSASLQFYWKIQKGRPRAFFHAKSDDWFWPGQGIQIDDTLLIFLMKIRASENAIGFETIGWGAVAVLNSHEDPDNWVLNWLSTPENEYGVMVGSGSILLLDNFVYAFSAAGAKAHDIFLVRWPKNSVVRQDLTAPEWWTGHEKGWIEQQNLTREPPPVFSDGQVEFTVHFEPLLGKFLEIQTKGFGASDIAFRMGETLTGPWSELQRFYRPDEFFKKNAVIYAGKAHPELTGANLVLTYVVNSTNFRRLIDDDSLYYPKFLKVNFKNIELKP